MAVTPSDTGGQAAGRRDMGDGRFSVTEPAKTGIAAFVAGWKSMVTGLGITLDPSHYIYGPHSGVEYEQVMKHVYHVRLRDTTKDQLQVRVGQGEVEYGRLVNQLHKVRYDRALCVDIQPTPDVDQLTEMRKIRLLLESLL